MKIELDQLSKKHPALYATILRDTGRKRGVHEIDIEGFTTEAQRKLKECEVLPPPDFNQRLREMKEHQQQVLKEQQPLAPQRDLEADVKRDLDNAAGLARIEQYAEQGLERTTENAAKIQEWLDKNVKGYMSPVGVDLALRWLGSGKGGSNVLTWRKPEPAPVAAAPTPAIEVLEVLSDGTVQLPLGTTPNKRHTVIQLRDLDRRQAAFRRQQAVPSLTGNFGTKF